MNSFYISTFNFARSYSYTKDGFNIRWSLDGIMLGGEMGSSLLDGKEYAGGITIPWQELNKKFEIVHNNKSIRVSIRLAENIDEWIEFVAKFPLEERIRAYGAYFQSSFLEGIINNTLSEAFFETILDSYNSIDAGSDNPEVIRHQLYWKSIYYRFLAREMTEYGENMDDTQINHLSERINNLK